MNPFLASCLRHSCGVPPLTFQQQSGVCVLLLGFLPTAHLVLKSSLGHPCHCPCEMQINRVANPHKGTISAITTRNYTDHP